MSIRPSGPCDCPKTYEVMVRRARARRSAGPGVRAPERRPSSRSYRAAFLPRGWPLVIAAAAAASVSTPAAAQWTVYDPANYAENVLHYTHQLLQIRYQLQQMQYQLQALAKLRGGAWRDVQRPLRDIETAMGGRSGLGYAAPQVGSTFATAFPVSRPVTDWPVEEQARSQSAVDVFGAAVLATASQQAAVGPGVAAVERMKRLNGQVTGHEQALELQNTAAVFGAEELMLLRQAAMAQTNIQAVYYANQVNAEAQRDASVRATLAQLVVAPVTPTVVSLRVTP